MGHYLDYSEFDRTTLKGQHHSLSWMDGKKESRAQEFVTLGAGETVGKGSAAKTDTLSLVPGTHMVEEENQPYVGAAGGPPNFTRVP